VSVNFLSASRIHNGKQWLPFGSVIEVAADGTIIDIHAARRIAPGTITYYEGILCPGFINAHCHIELSHMKGVIEEGNGLVPFLKSVMSGRNSFTPEEKREAIAAALREMEANGIVAVGDIANGTDTLEYRASAGFDIHTFIEALGFSEENLDQRFAWPAGVHRQFSEQRPERKEQLLRQSIVPHAPYSISEGMFRKIDAFEPGSLLSIHNEETEAENEFYRGKTGRMLELYDILKIDPSFFNPSGKTSLQTYLPLLSNAHSLLLVHNTFMTQEDLDVLTASGRDITLCLCPNANWYIERTLPPVDRLAASGLPLCLGTDSYASNYRLSIWSEIQRLQQHFPGIDMETLLCWATLNGARALKMDHKLGSFEPGKQPGIVHIVNDRAERVG